MAGDTAWWEPFVSFQNYVFFKRDSKRLINFRDLPFLLAKCFSVFLFAGFHVVHVACQKIARKGCLLHHNSSNFKSFLPVLLASLLYLLAYYAMWANSSKSSQPHENDWKWRSCSKQVLGICLLGVHGNVTILMLALGKSVKQTINFYRWCGFSMFFLPAECRPPPVAQKTGNTYCSTLFSGTLCELPKLRFLYKR